MGGRSAEAFAERQQRLERVLYVLEVALYSERPSLRRSSDKVRSVLGAIGLGDSRGLLQDAVHGALSGLKKSIRLRHFGRAYLLDAKEDLQRFADGGSPGRADWKRRDRMIEASCARLAEIARLDGFRCTPP